MEKFELLDRTHGKAKVFALQQPSDPVLVRGNRLCGPPASIQATSNDLVTWIALTESGRNLELAAFKGSEMPVGTNSRNLCATYHYMR